MRWRLRLSEYEFTIYHKKGRLNTQADVVSRPPSGGYTTEHEDYEVSCYILSSQPPPAQISVTERLREQKTDPLCREMESRLEMGKRLAFYTNSASSALERILPNHRPMSSQVSYSLEFSPMSITPSARDTKKADACISRCVGSPIGQEWSWIATSW